VTDTLDDGDPPGPYPVWDVSTWPVMFQEARGLDPKDWIAPPDQVDVKSQAGWWLFKPIKSASYRRYDDWSEKLAAALASLIDLPAARIELARGVSDEGIISRNVTPDGWSMESGDTLLDEYEGYVSCATDDRPSNRVGHNLGNIEDVLGGAGGPPGTVYEGWEAFDVFVGYLVFDAWIANTDRHAINWGVLTRDSDGERALAASFDHGSALASGAKDEHLAITRPEDYAVRGFAHRFEDGRKLPLVDLVFDAETRASPRAQIWRERLAAVEDGHLVSILGKVRGLSVTRATFLGNLLTINQRRLRP
jgi:hypothetical protein